MSQAVSSVSASGSRREEQSTLITRACDMCRHKKIRCEVVGEICSQCIKYKTPCHFTPLSGKRMPRRSHRDKRVEELEKRLKFMEDQLKRAVEHQHHGIDAGSRTESRGLQTPSSDQSQAGASYSTTQSIQGDDSAFSVVGVSPRASDYGVPFRKASFSTIVPDSQRAISPWTPGNNVSVRRALQALPPKDKALNLMKKSFKGFNTVYPLFDPATFMYTFEEMGTNINDLGWWACVNVVLALTHRFEGARALDKEEDREAWGYFQNALAVSNQLITMLPTLFSIQALLGMSFIIQGTPNQGPVSLLTSSAIKLAQRMGLHRRCQDPSLSEAEIEERKRIFWIAYSLDKDVSLQTGLPPTQDDDDMDVELPFENTNTLTHPGQIYKRLCSVKATNQSIPQRIIAAKELETMLQTWRSSIPIEHQRDYSGLSNLQLPASGPSRLPVLLQLAYFNSLATIYNSLPGLPRYQELQAPEDPVKVHFMSAPITYASEARKAIILLQVTPKRNHACIWAVLHIFVSATTTLLTHTISNPSNPFALADLKLIEPLLTLLGIEANKGTKHGPSKNNRINKVGEMYRSCVDLFERARIAVETFGFVGSIGGTNGGGGGGGRGDIGRDQSWDAGSDRSVTIAHTGVRTGTGGDGVGWRANGGGADGGGGGGGGREKESVEDFLSRMESISQGYDMDVSLSTSISPAAIEREFAFSH